MKGARLMDLDEKIKALQDSGFPIHSAYREDAEQFGYLNCSDVHPGYLAKLDRDDDVSESYVILEAVATGECRYGQSSTVERSNFRRLQEDYPDAFTNLSYVNVDVLGAFVSDLSDELVDVLCGLKLDYPLYDEDDLSALENDEIQAAWGQYLSWDLKREMTEEGQELWDLIGDEIVEAKFWTLVGRGDITPEHNGLEVVWYAYTHGPVDVAVALESALKGEYA